MRLSIFLVGMSSEDQRGILSIVSEADLWVFSTMTFFSFNYSGNPNPILLTILV